MVLTVVALVAAVLGYLTGSLITEARCWRTIRDNQDASNRMVERLNSIWREGAR